MACEIHKCTVAGVNDSYPGESIGTASIAGAISTKIAGPACSSVANALAERLPKLPSKMEEPNHWSPTQQEIDTYIHFLEQELLRSCADMPELVGRRYKWAAPTKDRPSDSFTLVWWLLGIAAGCLSGLASILLKALN